NSIVFSARSAPTPPSYSLIWHSQMPQTNEAPDIVGLAYSPLGHLYVVDAQQGVSVFDATSGIFLISYPFLNPTQPTSIAIDSNGVVYIGDAICRCLQVLANRAWREPVGSFGEGAPFHFSIAPDNTLYAIDRSEEGFTARVLSGGERAIPLNFNAAAPPLLTVDRTGNVRVIEWLSSLIDNQINGAISLLEGDTFSLQSWLEIAPDFVTDVAADPSGHVVLALTDGRIAMVDSTGTLSEIAHEESAPRAIAFSPDGTLFVAREDGAIAARSTSAPPERMGDGTIIHDLPVQGTLTEGSASHEWHYEGTAGEQITISAVDLTRTDALDMALRLIGPDGGERAYNDDQLGVDLYGRFDAQIVDFVLRDTGTYTIVVEWVRGAGTYTLGVSNNRHFELNPDVAARLEGHLQDVFPTQRWVFDGRAGQVVTFTMLAESGNLDPALELIQPGGSTLAYNDDAANPDLGTDAQLFRIQLPDDGVYVLEASRFDGTGRYSIVGLLNGE
ncbi:MAG TPA: pre-peptidase C-terminal domain-containing protein, partial [Oceanobacillus sp.]|nr:pre-peptidase C-terminal domain-containing protein [Oceanobacillus sp.]